MNSDAGTLASRLVGRYFSVSGDTLAIGGVDVATLAQSYGTPLFVYDAHIMRSSYRALSAALSGFAGIFFSIKANPNPEVAKIFVGEGAGLEIASGGEFEKALAAGAQPENILFAGPAKGERELYAALSGGAREIHLESFEEIERVAAISGKLGRKISVAVRVNPLAEAQGGAMRMGGKAAAFGFDEEVLGDVVAKIQSHSGLRLAGVHMFAGTQILDAEVLLAQWAHGLKVAGQVAELAEAQLETIDLGGGLGVPYFAGDTALDLSKLKSGISVLEKAKAADARIRDAQVIVEPGRYLTASAGVYLMQVRVAKLSRGERFVICDGGMHHHLAASGNLGQVIKRDYPIVPANKMTHAVAGAATVCGPLCTPLDTVGRKTQLPQLEADDLVAILQSGAYGLSASPVGFLSHPIAKEVMVDGGTHRQI